MDRSVMRLLSIWILLLWGVLPCSLLGQNTKKVVCGVLVDLEDNSPLDNVICEGLNEAQQLITYTLSTEQGHFYLEKKENLHFIAFRLLGYEYKVFSINDIEHSKENVIKLLKKDFSLQEIVVTVPPIEQSNDTIRYNISSFIGQEDRYVADVLQKLPGIKVNDKGLVTYQGESINKFYIEGRDLLGGQYNLATNNLTIDAVSHVEILENNQHIKALKGIVFSDKAALNLRLKKGYKIRPFGEAQAGVGVSPLLYDGKAFISYLSSKVQTIANFKVNNTGNDLLEEIEDKLEMNNHFVYEPLPENLLFLRSPQNISLEWKRYAFNRAYSGSVNSLLALSRDTELKVNFSYGSDRLEQNLYSQNNYNLGNGWLEIKEQSNLTNRISNHRLSAIIEHNSDGKYIKNSSVWYGKQTKSNTALSTDNRQMELSGRNKPDYLQNEFHALIRQRNNRSVEIHSFFRYSNNNEHLFADKKEENSNYLDEDFSGKYWVSKNRINSSFNVLNQRFNLGMVLVYKQRDLENDLQLKHWNEVMPEEWNIENITDRTKSIQIGIAPNYQFKSRDSRWVTTFDLPLTYNGYSHTNKTEKTLSDQKILFQPTIAYNLKINHQWEIRSRLGYDYKYTDDKSLLGNPFFRNYRMIYIPSGTLNSSRNYSLSAGVKYKNIVEMLFFNFNLLYRIMDADYINKSYNTSTYSCRTTEKKENINRQLLVTSDLSKTLTPLKLTFTITPAYTHVQSRLIQQDIPIFNTSHLTSLALKTDFKAIPKMTMIYSVAGDLIWNDNKLSDKNSLKSIRQKISFFFFPQKNLDIQAVVDHAVFELSKNEYNSFVFIDLIAKGKFKKSEIGFMASNLLDLQKYSVAHLSTVNSSYQSIPLRGREFLVTLKVNF